MRSIHELLSPADEQQLGRVVEIVRRVLGADALGAYLFGSAVLGRLHPHSDLDVLVISQRPTTHDEKATLVQRLLSISGRTTPQGMWRRVELTLVVASEVKPWRYPPRFDFQYGDWLRNDFERGNLEPWPTRINPDLAILITQTRLAGVPVFGPSPVDFFDPIPKEHLIQAMTSDIARLRAEIHSDTRNIVLTLARMWMTLATGAIRSKDAAADWCLERLPELHRPVLSRAKAIYLGEEEERWDDLRSELESFADHVTACIKELAGERPLQLHVDDPLAVKVTDAIRKGDTGVLEKLLSQTPALARARILRTEGESLTLLHVATDWPGHFPKVAESISLLVTAGADVNARYSGPHAETPLHFAASTDDVAALDALLNLGADIEASGGVIAGGTPLDDAVAFGNWNAARRLVERGAVTALWHAAALGMMDRIEAYFKGDAPPARYPWAAGAKDSRDDVTVAFWCACHGGQREAAAYLLYRGADLNWAAVWDGSTPLDAAMCAKAEDLVHWLRQRGAKSSEELD